MGQWLDVPKEMRKHESVAYKQIHVERDTRLGINAGSPAFLLDDPEDNTWCMKSAGLIVDPDQTYESLKDLGGRLKPAAVGRSGPWSLNGTSSSRRTRARP